jgi:iron complex transport system ATP-binding protein
MTTPLLAAEGLAVRIGERWLCCAFDLTVGSGECVAILGPNGAGKTTLLHTLAGLIPAGAGRVLLRGCPYAQWPTVQIARQRAMLPQRQPDHFAATVLETTLVGRHPHLGRWAWEGAADLAIARDCLQDMGLAAMDERDVLTLSGGERQRVAIAALLAQQADLDLLDEPLTHLDLHYQLAVLDLFRSRARDAGKAAIMVLHDINMAARFADRVLLLDGQGGIFAGSAEQVLQPEPLGRAFGHPLERHEIGGRPVFLPT